MRYLETVSIVAHEFMSDVLYMTIGKRNFIASQECKDGEAAKQKLWSSQTTIAHLP